jgi:hypothetical protein
MADPLARRDRTSKRRTSTEVRMLTLATGVLCLGFVVAISQASSFFRRVVEANAIEHAKSDSTALEGFRSLYTREVVQRVKGSGIRVTHD